MKAKYPGNVSEFIIQGFCDTPECQLPLFVLFLIIYLFIITGNLIIIFSILFNSNLHRPMYKFLQNLSLIDIYFTSNILPALLHLLITKQNKISFFWCMTQLYLYMSLAFSEYILLTAMSYDRYVAICDPFHYIARMSKKHCAWLISTSYCAGFVGSVGHVVLVSKLSYCKSHVIEHFFCDLIPLLKLSCSDTFNVEILTYVIGTSLSFNFFLFTLISYIFIISTILKIAVHTWTSKAFSTCASHLTCVIILYDTIICMDTRPIKAFNPKKDQCVTVLYIILIPIFNPVIYTLKNEDFKDSLRNLMLK
ncbi:hypothetical protein GDO86_013571, partial [Hymenochirus boettgeri]